MDSSAERPRASRKFGRSYVPFDQTDAVSAGSSRLRSIFIDVRLLLSKCRWGTLGQGPNEKPAGVIYMDIHIDSPDAIELKDATILLSLEESQDDRTGRGLPNEEDRSSGLLHFTEFYGPKSLVGEPMRTKVTRKQDMTPSISPLGFGAGGIGVTTRDGYKSHSIHRWSLTGCLLPGTNKNGARSDVYSNLRWHLAQNGVNSQELSSNRVFHVGFVLEHARKPFLLKVKIKGNLPVIKSRLQKWPPFKMSRHEDESIILIDTSGMCQAHSPLDQLARALPREMEMENVKQVWHPDFDREDLTAPTFENLALAMPLLGPRKPQVMPVEEVSGDRTVLSFAAGDGHLDVVKLFLENGAKPDQGDREGRTPLSWAAGNGHFNVVELLLKKEVELAGKDKAGRTPLSWAAGNGCLDVVELLLNRGLVSDEADKDGKTALAWAAQEGHEGIVQIILRHYRSVGPGKEDRGAGHEVFEITDAMIKTPLSLAAQHDHLPIMRMLVQVGRETSPDSMVWISRHLHNAVRDGRLSLVRIMFQYGATVDMRSEEPKRTPLCDAAEYGHADIILFLLDSGAELEDHTAEGETPLFLAVKNGREEAVKVLLDTGADIYCRCTNGKSIMDAAFDYPTILRMISEKDKDGNLAEEDPHADISQEFNAKVVFFSASSGTLRSTTRGVPVNALLADPASIQAPPEAEETSFKWFHLPANNMRWVEILISRYCDNPSVAFQILKPDRWVGRQHLGNTNAHQARFMQPLCQAFGPVAPVISSAEEQSLGDMDMVVFMPYLHWEENERLDRNKAVIKGGTNQEDPNWTKDQRLLHAYLFKDNPHSLHLLHIRRTLDQFCYYTLSDTEKRDQDQTVTRYQRKFREEPKVTAMVDQLWLWVLVGASGRADTIITCFPSKDGTQARSGPDPDGFTDVLQNIMLYVLYEPQAVRTAYDLAGVIASSCSRVFLGPSRARKILQFAEVYESAISDINLSIRSLPDTKVNKETELFDMFRALTEFRRKGPNPAEEILKILQELEAKQYVNPISLRRSLQKYYNDTIRPDIPDAGDVTALISRRSLITDQISEILQKLGNFHVLDISREITLLREIKDIQDELHIMAMVFEDQTRVLKEMERIVRSVEKTASSSRAIIMPPEGCLSRSMQRELYRASSEGTDNDLANGAGTRTPEPNRTTPRTQNPESEEHANIESESVYEDAEEAHEIPDENEKPIITVGRDQDVILRRQALGNYRQYIEEAQPASAIWGNSWDAKNSSLPLSTVQLSVGEIEWMARRAAKANQALDFLVDLKQKQSNVMDARSVRIQAEESLKMTKEAEKQGKTIMVFTIVTIVFLPMSFMAAFFAINITEFQRNDGGTLGLGYVLEIMVPISALVSFSFIYIAFKAESFDHLVVGIGRPINCLKPNSEFGEVTIDLGN